MAYSQTLFGLSRGFSHSKCCNRQKELPGVSSYHWAPPIVKHNYRNVSSPKYNKGLSLSHEERQRLNICGLLPPAYRTMTEQLHAVATNFAAQSTDLHRYMYLRELRNRHERLYFQFVTDHVKEVMPVVYTPTVGAACVHFSLLHFAILGMYICKFDKGRIVDVIKNWPEKDIRAVCITDGERILGLGDQGANGMGIPVGKLDLYTALGKIPPELLMPVLLDVGTNNKQHLADPLYIGVRQERIRGEEYEELVQELMDAIVECWGPQTLIHFEDFATPNAFKFIEKYKNCYCYFNDDIQGTAATGLAGFIGVERITKIPLEDHVILFVGAGSAAVGIGNLVIQEIISRGICEEEAAENIYMTDSLGLLTKDRENVLLGAKPFLKDMPPNKNLEDLVKQLKPTILLGATGVGGLFTENIIRTMAKNHKQPAIFAISNPTSQAECTAEQAYNFTEGRALFCSGSPFPPVVFNGKRFVPGQANNSFAFPGVALGVMCARPYNIPDDLFLVVAHTLAAYVVEDNPNTEKIYPDTAESCAVALMIAVQVVQYFIDHGLANLYPIPENLYEFVKCHQYYTNYKSLVASTWKYPKLPRLPLTKKPEKDLKSSPKK
ncbi:NADP-dependent malic enzyme-like [Drosophila innubila]|uniref:NADP-dependent malic enzyme-like n=1 Tax=Drosophila innubila TaxID=198719 RepID=UPI00148CD12C|nr:NADP-dependent malic enzyme-like [Drosophila innubila]